MVARTRIDAFSGKDAIVHLTAGFNFLGYNIRHYRTPKTTKTGWKLLIKPSKESVQNLRETLRGRWKKVRGPMSRRPQGVEPHHSWMGELLPRCCVKRTVWEVG